MDYIRILARWTVWAVAILFGGFALFSIASDLPQIIKIIAISLVIFAVPAVLIDDWFKRKFGAQN